VEKWGEKMKGKKDTS